MLLLQNKLFIFVFKETISEHHETFSPNCTRDLIDSFLEEMEQRKKETDSTFNGKAKKIYLPNIKRVLHLTAKFNATNIFTSFEYKEKFYKIIYFSSDFFLHSLYRSITLSLSLSFFFFNLFPPSFDSCHKLCLFPLLVLWKYLLSNDFQNLYLFI